MNLVYRLLILSLMTISLIACSDDKAHDGTNSSNKKENTKVINKIINNIMKGEVIDANQEDKMEKVLKDGESEYINNLSAKKAVILYDNLSKLTIDNYNIVSLIELNLIKKLSSNDNLCKDDKFEEYFVNGNKAEKLNPIDSSIYITNSFLVYVEFSRNEIPDMFNKTAQIRRKYNLRDYENDLAEQLDEEISKLAFEAVNITFDFPYKSNLPYSFNLNNLLAEIKGIESEYFNNDFEINDRPANFYSRFLDAADTYAETKIEHDLEDIHYRFGRYVDAMADDVISNSIGYKLLKLTNGQHFVDFLQSRLSEIKRNISLQKCLGVNCDDLIQSLNERARECY